MDLYVNVSVCHQLTMQLIVLFLKAFFEEKNRRKTNLLASDLFLKFLECLCKTFSDVGCIICEKKLILGLILTILIFLFAVPKLATQFLHSLKFLTHPISAIHV